MLIVEDDSVTALVLSEFLEASGFRTSVARNGTEGIAKFLAEPPDLAVVDVLLPRKDGFDVCFAIKRSPIGRTTPVMLMSAIYADTEETKGYARAAFADAFIHKPIDLDDLLARVNTLVNPP